MYKVKFISFLNKLLLGVFVVNFSTPFVKSSDINNLNNNNITEIHKFKIEENNPQFEYILGKGDLLEIIISREYPELIFKDIIIDIEGNINLPDLKKVYVDGLTIKELTKLLNKKYAKYIKNPNIQINIIDYKAASIYIKGEVVNPGLYVFNLNDSDDEGKNLKVPSITTVIKASKGLNLYSDLTNIEILRKNTLSNGGGYIKTNINFLEFVTTGKSENNLMLMDGDIVTINKSKVSYANQISKAIKTNLNPSQINIFVAGNVQRPGITTLNKVGTLNDALNFAGSEIPFKGKVKFKRYNNDGSVDERIVKYNAKAPNGSYQNPFLADGDIIFVERNLIGKTTSRISELTSPFVGIFTLKSLFDL